MVISHKYRYVFVQTMKTATSAIARELRDNYNGEMILEKHSTIADFLAQASEDEKTYFTFAGVRNPLDVLVSRFELRKNGRNSNADHREQQDFILQSGGDFNEFFLEYMVRREHPRYGFAIVPGDWMTESFQSIDYIYHYEELATAFPEILQRISIAPLRDLPMFNQTKGKRPFLDYYNAETLQLANQLFANYMQRWGYRSSVEK